MTHDLQSIIENAFEQRDTIRPNSGHDDVKEAVQQAIDMLNSGQARVAEKIAGEWVVHQWLKKAVLLY
ncbi:MAG: 2,3,4,5-tetrahydropyridine-2,6-dicarboxylate N-succinyltransferase, partial [Alteromonas sp.]